MQQRHANSQLSCRTFWMWVCMRIEAVTAHVVGPSSARVQNTGSGSVNSIKYHAPRSIKKDERRENAIHQ